MNPNLAKIVIDYLTPLTSLPFERELLFKTYPLKWDFDGFQYNPSYIRSINTYNTCRIVSEKWTIHQDFKWGLIRQLI